MTDYDRMCKTNVYKLIVLLGIPTTISMLITNIYNLADTYFVGTLGEGPQAATSVLFTLQCIIQAIAFMLGHGAGTYISKHLANNNKQMASKYISTSYFLGIFLGGGLLIFGLIFLEGFVKFLGSTEESVSFAMDYGMWIMISAPFMVCSLILNNALRYEGKAFYAMFGLVSGGLLNILGDYIFINVMHMGVFGAGMSTGISQIISFIILMILFFYHSETKLSIRFFSFNKDIITNIIRRGFPSLIRQGLTAISNGVLNVICKASGDALQAAMGIVSRYINFVLCIGIGIGQGFQPFVAFNYSAKKFNRVKRGFIFTLILSFSVVFIISLAGVIVPHFLVSLFQKEDAVIEYGGTALRYASIGIMFVPICTTCNMLYQSIRKSFIASMLALFRSGLVFIPLIYILEPTIGILGIQISMPISNMFAGLISIPFIILFLKKCPNEDVVSLEV